MSGFLSLRLIWRSNAENKIEYVETLCSWRLPCLPSIHQLVSGFSRDPESFEAPCSAAPRLPGHSASSSYTVDACCHPARCGGLWASRGVLVCFSVHSGSWPVWVQQTLAHPSTPLGSLSLCFCRCCMDSFPVSLQPVAQRSVGRKNNNESILGVISLNCKRHWSTASKAFCWNGTFSAVFCNKRKGVVTLRKEKSVWDSSSEYRLL